MHLLRAFSYFFKVYNCFSSVNVHHQLALIVCVSNHFLSFYTLYSLLSASFYKHYHLECPNGQGHALVWSQTIII